LFCRIADATEPASVVHADDAVVAFLDTAPVNAGHVLVAPRRHASGLTGLSDRDGVAVWRVAHRVAVALRKNPTWSEGVNLHLSDGEIAGQSVGHVHMHVIPRRTSDGMRIVEDNPPQRPSRGELDAVARDLAAALRQCAGEPRG